MRKPSIGRLTWKSTGRDSWSGRQGFDLNHNGERVGGVSGGGTQWIWTVTEDMDRGLVGARSEADSLDSAKVACEAHVRRCLELHSSNDLKCQQMREELEKAVSGTNAAREALEAAKDAYAAAREQEVGASAALHNYLKARLNGTAE